jgi:hypothetical protein
MRRDKKEEIHGVISAYDTDKKYTLSIRVRALKNFVYIHNKTTDAQLQICLITCYCS